MISHEAMRKSRKDAEMSILTLSRLSGVSADAIAKLESGQTAEPRLSTLIACADALHLSLDAYIGREPPKLPGERSESGVILWR